MTVAAPEPGCRAEGHGLSLPQHHHRFGSAGRSFTRAIASGGPLQISVVVPAFNEEAGIGRLLHGLTRSSESGPDIEIVVAPNGCTDGTAAVARRFGVRVAELPVASKTAALNAADAVAVTFPRIYLDADTVVSPDLIRMLAAAVSEPGVHGATPRLDVDLTGSSWPVRAFYAVNARLPVFRGRLFGRGVIALSRQARERFGRFPDLIADDLFLDAVVAADEKCEIEAGVSVRAPRRVRDLIHRVARAREGNVQFQRWRSEQASGSSTFSDPIAGPSVWSWLRDVVLRSPRLWPAAVCYVTVVLLAEATRRVPGWSVRSGWGRTGGRWPAEPADQAR